MSTGGGAVYILGKIGSERAIDHLIPLLKDEFVRWAAADALGKISKKFKEDDLFSLVDRLHKGGDDEAIDEIKKVQKRRFLKVLYPEVSKNVAP